MSTAIYTRKTKVESVFWATSAFELHVTSLILWESYNARSVPQDWLEKFGISSEFSLKGTLARTIGLNAGLSLELFLKACVVERYEELPNSQFHHRLKDIAKTGGVIFDTQELAQLDILTEYVYWAGKYPSNKQEHSVENLVKKMHDSGVSNASCYTTTPIELSDYRALWEKIFRHYSGIGGFGTLSPDGGYLKPFKGGQVWRVIKEVQEPHSTLCSDHRTQLTVVEAYILAEELNHERKSKHGSFDERYFIAEM